MNFDSIIMSWIHPLLQSETLAIWTLILSDKNNYLWPGVATMMAFLFIKKKAGGLICPDSNHHRFVGRRDFE